MSRKKRKRRPRKSVSKSAAEPVRPVAMGWGRDALAWWAACACLLVVTVWLGWLYHARVTAAPATPDTRAPARGTHVLQPSGRKARNLGALLAMTGDQLADVDIAEMSLLCAVGLPGATGLDMDHCLSTLDRWALRVKFETERHLYRAHDPRWADHYRHNEAYLRAEFLLQVLQQDLGVKYDVTASGNFDFSDSRVAFLHGMIPAAGKTTADTPGGTCASMPVLYVAIGRRLGYPLKLVTTHGHIFVRWDSKGHPNPAWRDRFNIEGAGGGFSSYDDEHYTTWPKKVTADEVRAYGYLVSLTPKEELAMFLAARGHCGLDNGQTAFAARCYENACRYDARRPCYRAWFLDAASRCRYRPATPALASLLTRHRRPTVVRQPTVDLGAPMPSATETSDLPGQSHIPRVGPWQPPPTMRGGPEPPTPPVPQVGHQPPAPR